MPQLTLVQREQLVASHDIVNGVEIEWLAEEVLPEAVQGRRFAKIKLFNGETYTGEIYLSETMLAVLADTINAELNEPANPEDESNEEYDEEGEEG